MKTRRFFILWIVFILLGVSARGAEKTYTFALGGNPISALAQYKTVLEDAMKLLAGKTRYTVAVKVFTNEEEFKKLLKTGGTDFFLSNSEDTYWAYLESSDFTPFMTISQGGAAASALCLYVRKEAPEKTLAELAGKKVLSYQFMSSYFMLRQLLGRAPEEFFSPLEAGPDGISMVYSLSMGETESVFVSRLTVEMMRQANPGPVKKIREAACAAPLTNAPAFYSKKTVPPDLLEAVGDLVVNARNDPAMKKYQPLMKIMKLRFVPVAPADYKPLLALKKKALAAGWDKDYAQWIKLAKPKGK